MTKPFSPKKAIQISFSKLIILLIIIIVILFLIPKAAETMLLTNWGIDSTKRLSWQQEYGFECDAYARNCNMLIEKCTKVNEQCNEDDVKKYTDYLKVTDCNKEPECTEKQKEKWEEFLEKYDMKEEDVEENNQATLFTPEKGTLEETEKVTEAEVKKITGDYDSIIEAFANEKQLDPNKLKAIIEVESKGKPFVGDHPTVRFECVRFNKVPEIQKVSCDTSKYKYGSSQDTGLDAFKRALAINRKEAISQTSFGLGQIMGFNYKAAGYNSEDDFYNAMFKEEEQVKAFLNFINANPKIVSEIKKDDTNWAVIAKIYNGPDYAANNYDKKLQDAHEALIA